MSQEVNNILGNSTVRTKIFKMQKKAIRTIMQSKNRDSSRDLFKKLKILPFHSQNILSLLLFVVDNKKKTNSMVWVHERTIPTERVDNKSMYNLNSDINNNNMRQKFKFHQHSANISLYRKGVYSFGIEEFNSLPQSLKAINNIKQFKRYLLVHSLLLLLRWIFPGKQTVTSNNSKLT
jgi:hypothetical protein